MVREKSTHPSPRPARERATPPVPPVDDLLYARVRLGIITALAINETLSFSALRQILKTSDGNLSVHARKLEDAQYIVCTKSFEGRLPKTEYRLTALGRRALDRYLDAMETLISVARS